MKATMITVLASVLLIAAAFILEPMIVAQPPAGVVAEPSMSLVPFAIGIVAISVSCLLARKFLGTGTVNANETNSKNPDSFSDRLALSVSWVGIALCGLLIVATVVAAIMSLSPGHDEGGKGMAIGIVYFMVIPAAAILAGLVCLTGALLCRKALRRQPTPALQNALRITTRLPWVAVMSWLAGLVVMAVFGK